ncbi:MAG: hypothetical protein A2Y25_00375 [Candidatus Melainabacteria bacterium GWF2_37_15]|nr:MAG: hypothetical protein A2Y25_00375 [Candidatus Melainabacteria bacterium GWF2_37_15]
MPKKKQEWTTPEEGIELLEKAEAKHGGFENIPAIDFEIDPKKLKTHLKSIRLTEYIIEGFEVLGEEYHVKPQTLMKEVLDEYLNNMLPKVRRTKNAF